MGFESPNNNLHDKDKAAKERFDKLPKSIRDIAIANKVNPEKIVSDSLGPEGASVEGVTDVLPDGAVLGRATPHKKVRGGMTHAAIVAQKMEEKENKLD